MWEYRGQKRPPFAQAPGAGQESVWDYPRPPLLAPDSRRVEVFFGDQRIADSRRTFRVLETASPPTFYMLRISRKVATHSGVKAATGSTRKLPPVGAKRRGMLHCYSAGVVVVNLA